VSKTIATFLLLVLSSLFLSACSKGKPDDKSLRVTRSGIFMKGIDHPLSEKELSDSLIPFCTERKRWLVDADSNARAQDALVLFRAALVRQPCKGLYHFHTPFSETWVMPLIPISRNYYSLDEMDTSKPILAMTVYAHEFGIGLTLMSGMLDPIHVVHTPAGKEYVWDPARKPPVAEAWIDEDGRCLVPLRKAYCTDTLLPHTRYTRVGQFGKLIDTIKSDSLPEDFKKRPLTLDMALRAQMHVLHTLKGSMGRGHYYHLIADSTLKANLLFDRMSAFRRIDIDFNTIELR